MNKVASGLWSSLAWLFLFFNFLTLLILGLILFTDLLSMKELSTSATELYSTITKAGSIASGADQTTSQILLGLKSFGVAFQSLINILFIFSGVSFLSHAGLLLQIRSMRKDARSMRSDGVTSVTH